MTEDLRKLLKTNASTFLERAVARELGELLYAAVPIGQVDLDASNWAQTWGLSDELVWAVIDRFQALGFWQIEQNATGGMLVCESMVGTASVIGKRKKIVAMKSIKNMSADDRASSLKLSEIGPTAMSAITDIIPKDKRQEALNQGYPGWLPTSRYWFEGVIFKPDEGLISKLREEFPDLCIDSCLTKMFDDFKKLKEKPTLKAMPFAIRRWIKANPTRAVVQQNAEDIALLAAARMDDY